MLQASTHERPAVRCAAMAALGGLTDATYSCLSLAEQRQIWHSIQTCGMACASAVQAAALKAAGALSACSSSQTYPGRNGLLKNAVMSIGRTLRISESHATELSDRKVQCIAAATPMCRFKGGNKEYVSYSHPFGRAWRFTCRSACSCELHQGQPNQFHGVRPGGCCMGACQRCRCSSQCHFLPCTHSDLHCRR